MSDLIGIDAAVEKLQPILDNTLDKLQAILHTELSETRDSVNQNLNSVLGEVAALRKVVETLMKRMDGASVQFNWGDNK